MRFWYQVKQSARKFESVCELIVGIKLTKLLTYTSRPPATSQDPGYVQLKQNCSSNTVTLNETFRIRS